MSKPQGELKEKDYYKNTHFLYEILNELRNVDEIKAFLKELLSPSELHMIKRRWHIANLLEEGLDIREIAAASKAGTNTVMKIKRITGKGEGIKLAIRRMQEKIKKEKEEFVKNSFPRGGSKFVKGWFR